MKTLVVKNIVIGEGIPKICISITGNTQEEILEQASNLKSVTFDIIEWRVDHFNEVSNLNNVVEVLKEIRNIFIDIPILFTFRTSKEGGKRTISIEEYKKLNVEIVKKGLVDLVDVEVFSGDEIVKEIIQNSHENGVKVVASNHDFLKTPIKEEIIARLIKMQKLGADIAKIAVMPNSKKDVLILLEATEEMNRLYAKGPIVTISMSDMGLISRISAEVFGSAITFGAGDNSSAPGQIKASQLKQVLETVHSSISL